MTLYQELKLSLELRLANSLNYEGVDSDIVTAWLQLKVRQIFAGKGYTIETLQNEINQMKEV